MSDTIIVFGSKRGRTAGMAQVIAEELENRGIGTDVRNVFETRPTDLLKYKYIILGSSTWSDGDLEVDFIDFERGMDKLDLKGRFCAVFGPGSTRFRFFCEAVNILEAKVRSLGARMILPPLKVNEMAGRVDEESREWGTILAEEIEQMI